jgi:hypothetical protein
MVEDGSAGVVERFNEMVRTAVERNLVRTDNMAPGEMRQVIHIDENGS